MTDRHKLLTAFSDLINDGVIAEPSFQHCRDCGVDSMLSEQASVWKQWNDDLPIGWVFYSQEDQEDLDERGYVHLSFGGYLPPSAKDDDRDDADHRIGVKIVDALTAQGLRTEWNGNPLSTIRVLLPNWTTG